MRLSILISLFFYSANLFSAELTLKTGERLLGELVKLEGDSVTWLSPGLGQITLAKRNIASLTTHTLLKINGHDKPCALYSIQWDETFYSCEDKTSNQLRVTALELIMPYEDYYQGAYSFRGKVAINGEYASGNTEEDTWAVDTEAEVRRGDYRHTLGAKYEYKSKQDNISENKLDTRYRLDWFFSERWFSYGQVMWAMDDSKKLDGRLNLGGGIGYQFWENDHSALALQTGINYVKEDRETDTSELESERHLWRIATDFRHKLPLSGEFFHRSQLLWPYDGGEDWEFESVTGINFPLGYGVFSGIQLDYEYDNIPADETEREDTRLKVGVGYEW
jgi:putative salt-induced outer membrane protein YdiY